MEKKYVMIKTVFLHLLLMWNEKKGAFGEPGQYHVTGFMKFAFWEKLFLDCSYNFWRK